MLFTYTIYNSDRERNFFMADKAKNERIMKRARSVIKVRTDDGRIKSDVNGSYTGVPFDKNEKPVQDADDL